MRQERLLHAAREGVTHAQNLPHVGDRIFGRGRARITPPTATAPAIGHLETIRCEPWSFEDHALVLGEAAHAIVPFHGQGMNAAFEDCSAFDQCLGDPDRPWNEFFAEFEKRRRPNTDAIADMAPENYVEMRSTVREPKFQLKKDLSFRLEERHPGRVIPRYSMVMFHTIPYAEAKRRRAIQEEILDELTSRAPSLDEVDLARADRLIAERLGTG